MNKGLSSDMEAFFEPTPCKPHEYVRTLMENDTIDYKCKHCPSAVIFASEEAEQKFLKLADKKTMDASKAS